MRDQYAGDVSDVLKFSFLRDLAGDDRTLGVAWYYGSGNDGGPDGRHLEWRDEPAWKELDPVVHAGLAGLPERSVAALEGADIWPHDTLFFRESMPPRPQREAWAVRKRTALQSVDIVFLDPDTGLREKVSERHATFDELRMLRTPERAIVFISFPGRKSHTVLVQELHERLRVETDTKSVATLRTSVSVPRASDPRFYVQRQRWFTVVDPDDELIARAQAFASALAAIPRVRAKLECTG